MWPEKDMKTWLKIMHWRGSPYLMGIPICSLKSPSTIVFDAQMVL